MVYTNVLWALVLDKLVFGVNPGWWSLCGGGLILGSVIVVAVQKRKRGELEKTDENVADQNEEAMEMVIPRGRRRGTELGTVEEEAFLFREDDPSDAEE